MKIYQTTYLKNAKYAMKIGFNLKINHYILYKNNPLFSIYQKTIWNGMNLIYIL